MVHVHHLRTVVGVISWKFKDPLWYNYTHLPWVRNCRRSQCQWVVSSLEGDTTHIGSSRPLICIEYGVSVTYLNLQFVWLYVMWFQLEDEPHDTIAFSVIGYFLYGNTNEEVSFSHVQFFRWGIGVWQQGHCLFLEANRKMVSETLVQWTVNFHQRIVYGASPALAVQLLCVAWCLLKKGSIA